MARKFNPKRASILGVNIRRRRRALGLSAEEVALLCGMSQSVLSRMESGRAAPSLELFCELCIALDVTPNDLLDLDNKAIRKNTPCPLPQNSVPSSA